LQTNKKKNQEKIMQLLTGFNQEKMYQIHLISSSRYDMTLTLSKMTIFHKTIVGVFFKL